MKKYRLLEPTERIEENDEWSDNRLNEWRKVKYTIGSLVSEWSSINQFRREIAS